MTSPAPRFKKRIFTIIEMLVVVAIMLILVSLTAPALKRAWDAAMQTQCASNQRQVGMLCQVYVDDYDGWEVIAGHKTSWDAAMSDQNRYESWTGWLLEYVGMKAGQDETLQYLIEPPGTAGAERRAWRTVPAVDCPSQMVFNQDNCFRVRRPYDQGDFDGKRFKITTSYNPVLGYQNRGQAPRDITQWTFPWKKSGKIKSTSQMMRAICSYRTNAVSDSQGVNNSYFHPDLEAPRLAFGTHGSYLNLNILFVDNHVVSLFPYEIPSENREDPFWDGN